MQDQSVIVSINLKDKKSVVDYDIKGDCIEMKNNLIKILLFSCVFLLLLNTSALASSQKTKLYNDVYSTHWAYDSILKMKNMNIMVEVNNGMFYPEKHVTRAEAVQYIYNTLKIERTTSTNFLFEDVPQDASYRDAVYTLASLGVIQNTNKFNPNEELTRAQLCKMIALAFNIVVDEKNSSNFRDVTSTHWAKNYIESLADVEILKGTGKDIFSPKGNVTRAQIATILDRSLNFQKQVASYEIVYDYLQSDYITSKNQYPTWSTNVITLVNEERKKEGLSSLQADSKLTQLAAIKANDMINRNYFEHNSPFYGYAWDMAGIFDYEFVSIGENIARNYTSPEGVVKGWLQSPSHKKNILTKSYTNIGVACIKGKDGQLYWVQLFSSK